jgi:hypothetical protein
MSNGTDQIANHFAALVGSGVCFAVPEDAAINWLPKGYRMVTDPDHVISHDDCVLPNLTNDWRLVSSINGGSRAGVKAKDIGGDIHFVATLK